MSDPVQIPMAEELPRTESACTVPPGFRFVPDGGVFGAILYFDGEDWVTLTPPTFAADQVLKYGTSGPYWSEQ